jgi:hypothetical protein
MQTPYGLPAGNVDAVINALRGPQGMQLAGDVTQLPVIPRDTAGPSAPTFESQKQLLSPYLDAMKSDTNLRAMPRDTILKWLASPSSQGRVYNPPPPVNLPGMLGGPNMPRGGGGGFLPPKL